MLGGLLAGKFYSKCKYSVKCINARLGPIRNKKQATVRWLKKDVADLIAAGHEANAFGRIDALIVEINRASCYDMIDHYCQYLLSLLQDLQKQRECPQEAMEAISTLIFAAAGFSDLPELCVLRQVFMERYGSSMESSVNLKFVEKIHNKSFSREEKLQLMQSIAEEFSVKWDSKTFGCQGHNPPALQPARPKKHTPSPQIKNDGASPMRAGTKEIPSKGKYGSNPINVVRRQQVEMEPKDIHVISKTNDRQSHDQVERTQKVVACDIDIPEACEANNKLPPSTKPKKSHDRIDKDDKTTDELPSSRTKNAQDDHICSLEKQELSSVKYVKPANIASLDTKPKGNKGFLEETRGNDLLPPYAKLDGVKHGHYAEEKDVNFQEYEKLQRHDEGSIPTGLNAHLRKPANNNRYVMPPYVKPYLPTKGDQMAQHKPATEDTGDHSDAVIYDEKPRPVSVRRKIPKSSIMEANERSVDEEKLVGDAPGGQRRYTGRLKSDTDNNYAEEKVTIRESWSAIDDEDDNAIDFGKLLPRVSNERRRHGSRHNAAKCAKEEKAMDKLLVRYSRKGMVKDPSREKTRVRAPSTNHDDPNIVEHPSNGRTHSFSAETVPPERTFSLPPEPVPSAAAKAPARATSMQSDASNPGGSRVHPNLPHYSQLIARVAVASARPTQMQPDTSNPVGSRVHPNLPHYSQLITRVAAIRNI